MPMKQTDWDAVLASSPMNTTAARAVSRSRTAPVELGAHKRNQNFMRSDVPFPVKKREDLSESGQKAHDEWVGKRVGQLVVVGISTAGKNGSKQARWVVRCDCGYYECRPMKSLTAERDQPHACSECEKLEWVRRGGKLYSPCPPEHVPDPVVGHADIGDGTPRDIWREIARLADDLREAGNTTKQIKADTRLLSETLEMDNNLIAATIKAVANGLPLPEELNAEA